MSLSSRPLPAANLVPDELDGPAGEVRHRAVQVPPERLQGHVAAEEEEHDDALAGDLAALWKTVVVSSVTEFSSTMIQLLVRCNFEIRKVGGQY